MTNNLFSPRKERLRLLSLLISAGPGSLVSHDIRDTEQHPHRANFQNINQNLNNIIHSAPCVSLGWMTEVKISHQSGLINREIENQ